jgi:hypothetical protein
MSNGIQTVDRVLQMLSAFGPQRLEVGVSDFAALLGVHKSTAAFSSSHLQGERGWKFREWDRFLGASVDVSEAPTWLAQLGPPKEATGYTKRPAARKASPWTAR